MSDKKDPLETLAAAHEESYHRRRDEALIEKLRLEMERQKTADAIKEQTSVADEELLQRLAEFGITQETVPVLHLLPLLDVAWADGEIQDNERTLLLDAAEATGVVSGPARERFEAYLSTPPPRDLVTAATDFIAQLLHVLPEGERDAIKGNLVEYSWRVADACGGVFGLWGRVEEEEKSALERIAKRLADGHEDAADALLKRL